MLEDRLGPDDPVYRMRVLAEFASDVEGQLIPLQAIQAAVDREFDDPEKDEKAAIVLGVDVARFGEDRTVVAVARGGRIVEVKAWRGLDTMATAARVSSEINACGFPPPRVLADEIGVGGGVVDRLMQLEHYVEPVNVGAASSKPATFTNLRAEIGWKIRAQFERGEVAIPEDPGLVSELAALRYTYDARGRSKLEAKPEAKARLGRSPDAADAVMLALWDSAGARSSEPLIRRHRLAEPVRRWREMYGRTEVMAT
jgi:hypothetical protein